MKRLILCLLLLSLSLGSMAQTGYTIIVRLKNVNTAYKPYLMCNKDGKITIDSNCVLENGAYVFRGNTAQPILAYLSTYDPAQRIKLKKGSVPAPLLTFFITNDVITIEGDANKIHCASVNGGLVNEEWNSIKPELARLTDQDWQAKKEAYALLLEGDSTKLNQYPILRSAIGDKQDELETSFISKYPRSLVSMMLLSNRSAFMPLEQLERAYNKLDNRYKSGPWAKMITGKMEGLKATAIGKMAQGFHKKDKDGNVVTLESLRGKYVLLDFWGSWCSPCRISHPHLKKLYQKYNDKGFEILGIAHENGASLAIQKKKWLQAIEEDALPWIQVLDNEDADRQNLVKLYGISAFPTKILINKEGKIIARYTGDGNEIDTKLAELMK